MSVDEVEKPSAKVSKARRAETYRGARRNAVRSIRALILKTERVLAAAHE
jgi:hypothetical protein